MTRRETHQIHYLTYSPLTPAITRRETHQIHYLTYSPLTPAITRRETHQIHYLTSLHSTNTCHHTERDAPDSLPNPTLH
ncbi:hypothetical protein CesoFtcFv8_022628 [Champsocephalus esox]|uniref:Uncharacterized protein n=1 Tax=Champsocephalus esox TaxID=159716 RepID=A0AAN8B6Q2_9TELE|nr:hypothetical protein CesoFtcFv8_022628 [Champsocephalus esox]